MQLDVEQVPLDEFVPLPPGAPGRRRSVGQFGSLHVYVFDLYSIALSKIARGFEADLDDVIFLLRAEPIRFSKLEEFFGTVLPEAPSVDIIPSQFRECFEELRRRYELIS
jgi:hypothetical protein